MRHAGEGAGWAGITHDSLSEIRALARDLEVQPLLGEVGLFRALREADLVVLVVLLHEVLDDSARLEQRQVGVGVVDRGQAAVGVDGRVLRFLDVGEGDVLDLVGQPEFLEDHDHLDRVGPGLAVGLDGF